MIRIDVSLGMKVEEVPITSAEMRRQCQESSFAVIFTGANGREYARITSYPNEERPLKQIAIQKSDVFQAVEAHFEYNTVKKVQRPARNYSQRFILSNADVAAAKKIAELMKAQKQNAGYVLIAFNYDPVDRPYQYFQNNLKPEYLCEPTSDIIKLTFRNMFNKQENQFSHVELKLWKGANRAAVDATPMLPIPPSSADVLPPDIAEKLEPKGLGGALGSLFKKK